jgi:hypothetical protein
MSQLHLRVLAVIGVLLGVFLTVPSASTAVSADAATKAGVRFTILTTNPDESVPSPMAASGAIHAKGTDVIVSEAKDRFEFPDGTITIKHKREGKYSEKFDEVTCLFTFKERGTWKVVEGTGAYADTKGSGKYRAYGQGFGCDENTPPEGFFFQIVCVGNVT